MFAICIDGCCLTYDREFTILIYGCCLTYDHEFTIFMYGCCLTYDHECTCNEVLKYWSSSSSSKSTCGVTRCWKLAAYLETIAGAIHEAGWLYGHWNCIRLFSVENGWSRHYQAFQCRERDEVNTRAYLQFSSFLNLSVLFVLVCSFPSICFCFVLFKQSYDFTQK